MITKKVAGTKNHDGKIAGVIFLICMVIVAALSGRSLLQSQNIAVLNDEFGYWGIAASLAGKDWTDLLGYTPYYSFGYSLLLVPLFWLGLDMATMYHIALVLNVVMLLLAFLIAVRVLHRLLPSHSYTFCVLVSFCATVYTNNLVQAQGAWTETLLFFLFWLILWQVIRTCHNASALNVSFLAVLGVYTYAVHMRALGIVVSLFLVVLGLRWIGKIKVPNLILFCAVLILGMAANEGIKAFLQNNYFTSTALSASNDYSGQTQKLVYIFTTLEGFLNFLSSILGKIFYFETSTLIVGGVGVAFCLTVAFQVVKKILQGNNRQIKVFELPYVYLSLAFLSTFAIAAISAWAVTYHLEVAVYGRYMEFAFGPFIAIGIVLLADRQVSLRAIAVHLAILLVSAIVTNQTLLQTYSLGQKEFNWLCITSWKRIYELFASLAMFPFFLVCVCAAVFFLGWGWSRWAGTRQKANSKSGNLLGIAGVTVCLAFAWIWAATGESSFEEHQTRSGDYLSVVEMLFENAGQVPDEVAILLDDSDDLSTQYQLKYVQARYPDLKMSVENVEQWNTAPADVVFTLPGSTVSDLLYNDYLCVTENSWFCLYVKADTVWGQAASQTYIDLEQNARLYQMVVDEEGNRKDSPLEVTTSTQPDQDGRQQACIQMDCVLNGDSSASLYGPYISLPKGKYVVEFDMEVLSNRSGQNNVAQYVIQAEYGEQQLGQGAIQADTTGQLNTTIEFEQIQEMLGNIEFVIQPTAGVELRVTAIRLTYLEKISEVFVQDSQEIRQLERYLQMDPEAMPLYCVLPPKEKDSTVEDLRNRFPERQISVVTQADGLAGRNAVVLVETEDRDVVQSLLSDDTVIAKIGQYTLMIPSQGQMMENYLAHGGVPLSKGDALSFRYYASGNETGASSLSASLPAGKYELLYDIAFSSDLELQYGTIYCEANDKMVYSQKVSEQDIQNGQYQTSLEVTLNEASECKVSMSGNISSNVSQFNVYVRRTGDVEAAEPLA